jgi:hypothetical protein
VANVVANAVDPVEVALAEGLRRATEAGEWGIVAQLARELETRRVQRCSNNVVILANRRPPAEL